MAWTAPMTAVAGSVFTAAQFNTFIRDNLAEVAPAKATTPGGYFTTTATNQIVERTAKIGVDLSTGTTTSTSFTDLDTGPGPSVTVETSNCALVLFSASLQNSSASSARVGFDISGATTMAASDNRGLATFGVASNGILAGNAVFHTDLTAGTNTFTMKYRVAGGTGTFLSRRLHVMPF
ncbi:hypothetical protein ABTY20_22945 [Streptomyces sp. NPDC126497]|uniref:hypothetical protein n=1 Tax=Streptomyces sp. NPDC126497 TaxID=3155313 RepID=UPI00332A8813